MNSISYDVKKNRLMARCYDNLSKHIKRGPFELWLDQDSNISVLSINHFADVSKDFEYCYKEKAIHALRGKYRNQLSSSEEFARQKQVEIELEEQKWKER